MFEQIRIVLIGTTHPGNIGATARAMKTMGLTQLVLVAPAQYPDEQATTMASNAGDVLQQARVVETLDQALEGCELILGSSARTRYLDWSVLPPREAAQQAYDYCQGASQRTVAILFGRERNGLTNEELQRCHAHIHIPANPDYSSLNLAAAVQLIGYELRLAWLAQQPVAPADPIATEREMQQLYQHLEQALLQIDFINPKAPKQVMGRLKRLLQRARCEPEEVNILRGICSKIMKQQTGCPPARE